MTIAKLGGESHDLSFNLTCLFTSSCETATLLFATQVVVQLQAQGVTFLTDNLTLSKDASSTIITDAQVP
jgi:hypothetical protein